MDDYRRHAEECRKLARRARTQTEQEKILLMAEGWEQLAASREKWETARAEIREKWEKARAEISVIRENKKEA